MRYVQTLRILNGLKWLAIVLGAIYVFIVVIAASTGVLGHISKADDPNFEIPLPALFAIAGFFSGVVISRYGRTLSEENDESLPVAWTRPMSRTQSVLAMVGVDALGVLAMFALYLILSAALIVTFQVSKYVVFPSDWVAQFVRFIIEPFAVYGLVMAITASAKSAGRTLLGWTWVAMIFLGVLAASPHIGNPWHAIFNVVNFINPLAYGSYSSTKGGETVHVIGGPGQSFIAGFTPAMDAAALAILFAVGLAAAILQWRRLEA